MRSVIMKFIMHFNSDVEFKCNGIRLWNSAESQPSVINRE